MAKLFIDEMIVALGFDPSAFTRGQKQAAAEAVKTRAVIEREAKAKEKAEERAAKAVDRAQRDAARAAEDAARRIASAQDKAAASLDRTVRNFMRLTALFTAGAGVAEFTSRITAADAAVGRLATSLGAAPEDISAIANAIERSGGSADAATASYKRLADGIQEIKVRGDGVMRQPLLEIQAAGGKNLDLSKKQLDIYADIADNLKAINDQRGAMAATFFGQQAGFDEGTIALMRQGGDAFRKAVAESKKFGGTTKESAEAAQAFTTALVTLKQISEDLGRTIVTAVTPTIVGLLRELRDWVQANREVINSRINEFVEAFKTMLKEIDWPTLIRGITDFAKGANDAAQAVGGWVTVCKAFFGLWAASKVTGVIASILRIRALLFGGGALFGGILGLPLLGTAAVGAALASGDPSKSVNGSGGVPAGSMNPGDELPGVDSSENRRASRKGVFARAAHAVMNRMRRGGGGIGKVQQNANSAAVLDEFKKAGLPPEGVAALMGSAQTESSFNPRAANDQNGGHTGLLQWDKNRWPRIEKWIRAQGGDPYDARWQARAAIAEGSAKPGDDLYDHPRTARGWQALRDSAGNLPKAMGGIRDIERYGFTEEGGRGANARGWLGTMTGGSPNPAAGDVAPTNGVGGVDQRQGGAKHRRQNITEELRNQIAGAAAAAGVNAEIFSGGQSEDGPDHYGSHRHDHGRSADLKLYTTGPDGKKRYLDQRVEADRAVMEKFMRGTVQRGANGVGAGPGYMGGAESMHIGGGSPSAWGAGGASANAPDWVRRAHQEGMAARGAKPEARVRGADPGPIFAALNDLRRRPYMKGYGNVPGGYQLDTAQRMASAQGSRFSSSTSHVDRSSTSQTTFNGPINVQTAATDASGIARDMEASLRGRNFAIQSNTGVA